MLSSISSYSSTICCSSTILNEIITVIMFNLSIVFGNLGKFKANYTQGQFWWATIGQGNLSLSLMFYSPVITWAQNGCDIKATQYSPDFKKMLFDRQITLTQKLYFPLTYSYLILVSRELSEVSCFDYTHIYILVYLCCTHISQHSIV